MGLFSDIFDVTVGSVLRAPVAAIKVVDDIIDGDDLFEDAADTTAYLFTGQSDNPSYDGKIDLNRD